MVGSRIQNAIGDGEIFHCEDGIATAEFGHIFIAVWSDAVIQRRFSVQRRDLEKVIRRHPKGSAFLCLIEESAKPPDEKLRKASYEMVIEHKDSLKCVACVIEGSGFKSATTRSVLSGMVLLSGRREPPLSIFATVNSAAQWINKRLATNPNVLSNFVKDLQSRLAQTSQKQG